LNFHNKAIGKIAEVGLGLSMNLVNKLGGVCNPVLNLFKSAQRTEAISFAPLKSNMKLSE